MNKNRTFFLGFCAQFLQYGTALLILPFITIFLSEEKVGLWFVFLTIIALSMLLDFGFQPTFARNFALAYSGVDSLQKLGISAQENNHPNYSLVLELLKTAKLIYLLISIVTFLLLLLAGTQYIEYLVSQDVTLSYNEVSLAWYILIVGVSLNACFMWISPFLIGSDNVDKNYIYLIVNKIVFASIGIALLFLNAGLLGLASAFVMGVISARLTASFLTRNELKKCIDKKGERSGAGSYFEILKIIWPTASRMGVVSISTFLILRYNLLVVSSFFGLKVAASYGLTLQVLMALNSVGQLLFQINLPGMVKARVDRNSEILRRIYLKSTWYFFLMFLAGVPFLAVWGNDILSIIGSSTKLLDFKMLMLFSVIVMLEGNHSNAGLVITTGNNIPFMLSSVLSGVSIGLLSVSSGSLGLGLFYILLAQGVVQILYNNWRWPLYVYQEIKGMEA